MNLQKSYLKITLVLSILVGILTPVCHEWLFDQSEINVHLPETWKQMSTQEKLDCLGGLLSRDAPFFLLAEIRQLNIRRQFKKMIVDRKDEVLRGGVEYSFGFRFRLGWEELSLLGVVGFALVWMTSISVKAIVFFIVPLKLYLSHPWDARGRKPARLPSVQVTLSGLLSFEERPKRPGKPRAVWID